jgi:coenzyme F420-0:L-glutamate ligase/coenzyme F420-1:gamma-L-glutamate ligase
MKAIHDYRSRRDPHGYRLRVTLDAVADELACAAGLLSGKLTRTPFVIIRGFPYQPGHGSFRHLLRPAALDLFR